MPGERCGQTTFPGRQQVGYVAKTHWDAERCVIASSTHPTGLRHPPRLDPSLLELNPKAIRRAHLRLGHRAPGRGGRRARTVSGCVSSAFLNISQHFTGHLFRPWRPSSAHGSDGGPRGSTEVVLHAPRAEPAAETPAAFWKKRQGSRKIKLSGKKTAVGADRTRVAAGFFVLHNGGHGPCLSPHALRRGRRGPAGPDRTAK